LGAIDPRATRLKTKAKRYPLDIIGALQLARGGVAASVIPEF